MTIPLFDVQSGFGGARSGQKALISAADCLARMDRMEIGRALVRTTPEDRDCDPIKSNEQLFAACPDGSRLVPCPVIFPSAADGLPPESQQVATFIDLGAGAVWIRPTHDAWLLTEWACGSLMEALAERRLPVFCLERMVDIEAVADLAGRYSGLPVILAETGYRSQRTLLPLLERFPNVYLSLGGVYAVHGGIEQLVQSVGPERLLFGTGFPEVEPMMAVTQLAYAGISDAEKELIGSANFERLTGGIQR